MLSLDIPAFPPPKGVKTDFNSSDSYILENYILHSVVLLASTLAVAVRIYTRRCIKNFLGVDDYFTLLSWVLAAVFSSLMITANTHGYGQHVWNVRFAKLYDIGKLQFIGQMIYIVLLIAIKVAILLTYLRIFGVSRAAKILIWIGVAVTSVFYTICLLMSLLWCKPLEKVWFPFTDGKCAPYDANLALGTASGVVNVITDFYILVLPMPFVWRLNMGKRRKTRLLMVFGLGLFTCVFSILRLAVTIKYIPHFDNMYYFAKYMPFLVLEVHIGLICGCSLVFPAFFESARFGSMGSLISRLHNLRIRSTSDSESATELRSKDLYPFF